MDLTKVIDEAKEKTGMTQDQLATRIGLDRTALSHILHGRRRLPATAAIELFDLTGIHPRDILNATVTKKPRSGQGLKAACVALAVVSLFWSGVENRAFASSGYEMQMARNADSPVCGYRSH